VGPLVALLGDAWDDVAVAAARWLADAGARHPGLARAALQHGAWELASGFGQRAPGLGTPGSAQAAGDLVRTLAAAQGETPSV
jgi:hypothetical protein